jgi:hypothetical protein
MEAIMPVSPNRDLSPCVVVWEPGLLEVKIEKTHGGVFFLDEIRKQEINEDQQGETPVDRVTKGRLCSLTVPMTRYTIAQLAKFIDGGVDGTPIAKLEVSNVVGGTEFSRAKEIIVKPIIDGAISVDADEWLHIHRAYPTTNLNQAYDNAGQRNVDIVFNGYPDDLSGQVNEMWRFGPDT